MISISFFWPDTHIQYEMICITVAITGGDSAHIVIVRVHTVTIHAHSHPRIEQAVMVDTGQITAISVCL